jgi:hypothetical protein
LQWYWKHGLRYLAEYLGDADGSKPLGSGIKMDEVVDGLRAWASFPLIPELSTAERQEIKACTATILSTLKLKWRRSLARPHQPHARADFAVAHLDSRRSAPSAVESLVPALADFQMTPQFLKTGSSPPLCFGRSEMSALAEHVLLNSVRRSA